MSEKEQKEQRSTRESVATLAKARLEESNMDDLDEDEHDNDEGEELDYEDRVIENSKSSDELDNEVSRKEAYDMLEEFHNKRVKKGVDMTAKISKNGKLLCTLDNQLITWDRLHREYGEGTVKVTSSYYNHKNKKITQSQTQVFGPYTPIKLDINKHEERSQLIKEKDTSMTESFSLIAKAQEAAEERAEKRANQTISLMKEVIASRPEPKSDNTLEFMKMMMEMNSKAEERTQALIKEMNDKHERALEKSQAQMEKLMSENARTVEKILESASSKDEGYDPLKIQQMIDRAKKEGQEESDRIHAMIEEKAEVIAKKSKNGSSEEKDESILDKTIKSFLPLAPAILSKVMTPTPPQAPQFNPNTVVIPQTQRQLPPPKAPKAPVNIQKPVSNVKPNPANNVVRKGGMVTVLPTPKGKVDEKNNSAKIPEVANDKHYAQELEAKVISIASPLILEGLMNETGSLNTAKKVKETLLANKVNLSEACKVVSLEKVNDLANTNGLFAIADKSNKREELSTWLKTFYEELSTSSL